MPNTPAIIDRARRFLGSKAVSGSKETLSYGEILGMASLVTARLLENSEDLAEEPVVFLAPPGGAYVAMLWGIWRAGGIAVPLNVHATQPEMQYCAETAGARLMLADDSLAGQAMALASSCMLETVWAGEMFAGSSEFAHDGDIKHFPEVAVGRRALMVFTSGTTSKPKGVITTHANIEAQITALVETWGWQQKDRIPLFLPLHHVHGLINILCCALWTGAEVEIFSSGFDPQRVLKGAASERWTLFMAVPTIYVKLIAAIDAASDAAARLYCRGFGSMRLMVSGSAALPASVHARWEELTGQRLLERYGMTEIGMALSNPLQGERRPGFVGMPLPGVELRLVADGGEIVASHGDVEGPPGEIQVRGPNVFLEYWNDRPATAAAFTEDGWFRTGDMAVQEDGYYRIMGRLSVDIIKSGGYKLSALEIESVLLDHPDIRECAVVGLADSVWGEKVAAVVVLHEGSELTLPMLITWADKRMSSYKLPRLLSILDSLPRNAMGKVLKPELITSLQRV